VQDKVDWKGLRVKNENILQHFRNSCTILSIFRLENEDGRVGSFETFEASYQITSVISHKIVIYLILYCVCNVHYKQIIYFLYGETIIFLNKLYTIYRHNCLTFVPKFMKPDTCSKSGKEGRKLRAS
jgi:hypothetical protein